MQSMRECGGRHPSPGGLCAMSANRTLDLTATMRRDSVNQTGRKLRKAKTQYLSQEVRDETCYRRFRNWMFADFSWPSFHRRGPIGIRARLWCCGSKAAQRAELGSWAAAGS